MFKCWLIGAVIAFLIGFFVVIYCSKREQEFPFWRICVLAFAAGCGVGILSWLGVFLVLMALSVSQND